VIVVILLARDADNLKGYRNAALELLTHAALSTGDMVVVRTRHGEMSGILMPRYESADKDHIVIKLNSGYNIGIDISNIESISKTVKLRNQETPIRTTNGETDKVTTNFEFKEENTRELFSAEKVKRDLPRIALISTGGTIASKIDYKTGGVKAALSAVELYESVPELADYAIVEPEVLLSEYSENLNTQHWELIAKKVFEKWRSDDYRGIIISHGTDTMHYTASALSFALQGIPIPIVLVGAQRSSDRPSSDAAFNLLGATLFALKSNVTGVFVAMHAGTSDDTIACHIGTRVRKNHASRRDAFESIDVEPVAIIKDEYVCVRNGWESMRKKERSSNHNSEIHQFSVRPNFDPRAALLKFHPGFDPQLISHIVELGHRAIILEGTGLGHVSRDCFPELQKALNAGIMIFMTSQCIWGRTGMTVYNTGRDLLEMGVVPLSDMLPETAIVKAMWVLANSSNSASAKKLMQENLAYEISPISPIL
jgi:glutamyl-tRNA(Gln) amidotransferase subunit D